MRIDSQRHHTLTRARFLKERSEFVEYGRRLLTVRTSALDHLPSAYTLHTFVIARADLD